VKAIDWITAWKMAVDAHFVGAERDEDVRRLLGVYASLLFQPPEVAGNFGLLAWDVFLHVGDTDVGRAAVALAYIASDTLKNWQASGYRVVAPPKDGPLPTVTGS